MELMRKKRTVLRGILNFTYFIGGFSGLFLSAYMNSELYSYFDNFDINSYIVLFIAIIIIMFSFFITIVTPLAIIYTILIYFIKYISPLEFKEFIYNEKSYYGKNQK